MAFILPIEEPWTSQPQVVASLDTSNALVGTSSNVLVGSNPTIDLATGRPFSLAAGTSIVPSENGLALYGKGNAGAQLGNKVVNAVPMTVALWCRGMFYCNAHQLISATNGIIWSGGYKAQAQLWDASVGSAKTITSGALTATRFYKIVITIDEAKVMSLYVDGSLIGTQSIGSFASDSLPELGITFQDSSTYGWCAQAFKTNVAWRVHHVAKWGSNPWQLFAP